MSWITKSSLNWMQWFCVNVLKCGPVPKHVAFIMDGNRRYAKKNNVQKIEGHSKGFDKLSETLQWCLDLGIHEVTVYAFSIENFKRSKDEVDALMNLAREKFQRLIDEREKLKANGVRIKVIGNWSLLPDDFVKLLSEAELITKDNNKCFLNVAFSYTARDEITHAINLVVNGVSAGIIEEKHISHELLSKCLYTRDSCEPDLLIRTSGETRLSDFLLWQASFSYLYFADVLWPDFSAWDLISGVFQYQRAYSKLNLARENFKLHQIKERDDEINSSVSSNKVKTFLQMVDDRYWDNIRKSLSA